MREFKDSITGKDDEEKQLEETKAQMTEQSPATTAEVDEEKADDERVEADVVSDPRS